MKNLTLKNNHMFLIILIILVVSSQSEFKAQNKNDVPMFDTLENNMFVKARNPIFNLVPNPSFENRKVGWDFFIIKEKASGEYDSVQSKTGNLSYKFKLNNSGEAFLHSAVFNVKPGGKYELSAWIRGNGNAHMEILWWKTFTGMYIKESNHHRDVLNNYKAVNSWEKISGKITAPKDAHMVYIRLVATKGNVWFDDIVMHYISSRDN